jgi:hypothetical protein
MVKVLGRPHHFHFLSLLQPNLIHFQYLSYERAGHLPARFSL